MAASVVLDPRPIDYRETRLCGISIAPDLPEMLGTEVGDLLRLSTARGRTAFCRVTEITNEVDHGAVRVDRFTRQALKAYPHEQLTVEVAKVPPTTELALLPATHASQRYDPQLIPTLKQELAGQRVAVRSGMILYIRLPDRLAGVTYDVHYVKDDEGVVTDETTIWIIQRDHDHGPGDHIHDHDQTAETVVDTTFEDVGGLSDQIREVRELVELPLVFPQVYRQLGITQPRGVLFYGPPGTGKTLLARSVANEINAQLFYVNGPEIVGTFSGETEANLRKIFAEASANPPSIIFVDELDAIAPTRRTAANHSDARAVTQLLALLDGLKRTEGVIVIGTTNRVDAIDPALRRAGRFDREILFPTPSATARAEILRVLTREMPLNDNALAALPEIAHRAHGFVGADLMEMSREAGLNALRRNSARFVEVPSPSSYPRPEDLVVQPQDFEAALARVRPASMRESLITFPDVTWGNIGGLDHAKKRLRDLVQLPLHRPELLSRAGLSSNLGIVLYGPPGTGKTLLAKAIAREAGVNFLPIQGPEFFSQWLGESEESVRHIFDIARRAAPCIVHFDQLDAVAPKRSDLEQEGTRAPQRVVNQLLVELDGLEERSRVIVIGATNRLSMVDPAVLRPGRLGIHLDIRLPSEVERAAILQVHLRDTNFAEGIERDRLLAELAGGTEGLTGADLAFLCQTAKLAALEASDFLDDVDLEVEHLAAALRELWPERLSQRNRRRQGGVAAKDRLAAFSWRRRAKLRLLVRHTPTRSRSRQHASSRDT